VEKFQNLVALWYIQDNSIAEWKALWDPLTGAGIGRKCVGLRDLPTSIGLRAGIWRSA
jgi:hypothetical protein